MCISYLLCFGLVERARSHQVDSSHLSSLCIYLLKAVLCLSGSLTRCGKVAITLQLSFPSLPLCPTVRRGFVIMRKNWRCGSVVEVHTACSARSWVGGRGASHVRQPEFSCHCSACGESFYLLGGKKCLRNVNKKISTCHWAKHYLWFGIWPGSPRGGVKSVL